MDSVSSPVSFWPTEGRFWALHLSGVLILFLFQWSVFFFQAEARSFNLAVVYTWPAVFTVAVLIYRYLVKTTGLNQLAAWRMVLASLAYAAVASFIMMSVFLLYLLLPMPWQFLSDHALQTMGVNRSTVIKSYYLNNMIVQSLYLCAWMFSYSWLVSDRKARATVLENLALQANLKQAQLAQLASQLNPHFLFNALNNIRFVMYEDTARADQAITSLSDLLRYSISSGKQSLVSLKQELTMTQRYIDIMSLHLDGRMETNYDIQTDVLAYSTPPMMLQLLVENAIKHGLERCINGGVLQISLVQQQGVLRLTVQNPLPNQPDPNTGSSTPSTGTGLINIQRRLALLYGDNATLSTQYQPHQFTVTVNWPATLWTP